MSSEWMCKQAASCATTCDECWAVGTRYVSLSRRANPQRYPRLVIHPPDWFREDSGPITVAWCDVPDSPSGLR